MLSFLTCFLLACAPSIVWFQAGVSEAQRDSDLRSCQTEAERTVAKPVLEPYPAFYGDGIAPNADEQLFEDLLDIFVDEVDELKAELSAREPVVIIDFSIPQYRFLQSELENVLEGEAVYRLSTGDLWMRDEINEVFLLTIDLIKSTPPTDLVSLWDNFDAKQKIDNAFFAYDNEIGNSIGLRNRPLEQAYRAELEAALNSCMRSLGYQLTEQ
jgi:hypothetical protein